MGKCIERHLAHACDQHAEWRVAGHIHPQGQNIEKAADQPLELGACPSRDAAADHEIILLAVAMQESGDGGHECHEERGAFLPPDRP